MLFLLDVSNSVTYMHRRCYHHLYMVSEKNGLKIEGERERSIATVLRILVHSISTVYWLTLDSITTIDCIVISSGFMTFYVSVPFNMSYFFPPFVILNIQQVHLCSALEKLPMKLSCCCYSIRRWQQRWQRQPRTMIQRKRLKFIHFSSATQLLLFLQH